MTSRDAFPRRTLTNLQPGDRIRLRPDTWVPVKHSDPIITRRWAVHATVVDVSKPGDGTVIVSTTVRTLPPLDPRRMAALYPRDEDDAVLPNPKGSP